eukprot:m.234473 g.234473  ORF g.234473 m.234473 type:complete len:648 (+) comp12663_c0_seq1:63-2006(+)
MAPDSLAGPELIVLGKRAGQWVEGAARRAELGNRLVGRLEGLDQRLERLAARHHVTRGRGQQLRRRRSGRGVQENHHLGAGQHVRERTLVLLEELRIEGLGVCRRAEVARQFCFDDRGDLGACGLERGIERAEEAHALRVQAGVVGIERAGAVQRLQHQERLLLAPVDLEGGEVDIDVVAREVLQRLDKLDRLIQRRARLRQQQALGVCVLLCLLVTVLVALGLLLLDLGGGGRRLLGLGALGGLALLAQQLLLLLLAQPLHARLLLRRDGGRERDVVQPEIRVDRNQRGPHEELVALQHVLQAQQPDVGAQGNLAHAVRVEVELVVGELVEMRPNCMQLLERLADGALADERERLLGLEPHALHVRQLLHRVRSLPCEHRRKLLGAGNVARTQAVLDALGVDVAVCRVQLARRVHHLGGLDKIAAMLQNLCLNQIQINQRRRVLDCSLDQLQRLGRPAKVVLVLRQHVVRPQQRRGGLDRVVGRRELSGRRERGHIAEQQLLDDSRLGGVAVKHTNIAEDRRHALPDVDPQILVDQRAERGARRDGQRQAPQHVRGAVLLRQLLLEEAQAVRLGLGIDAQALLQAQIIRLVLRVPRQQLAVQRLGLRQLAQADVQLGDRLHVQQLVHHELLVLLEVCQRALVVAGL